MLLLELVRSREGLEWVDVGLEDGSGVKKDAGRLFLSVAEVGTGGSSSSIGVRAFIGGLNILKLFRRRRSDIVVGVVGTNCSDSEVKDEEQEQTQKHEQS